MKRPSPEYNEYLREWRRTRLDREAERARVKKWRDENPSKERERTLRNSRLRKQLKRQTSEAYTVAQLVETYGSLCYLCGEEIDLTAPRKTGTPGWERGLHVDHLVSITEGGPDNLENARPSHGKCNLKKGRRST
jgi:5-methylcytosine-specific restriction endonuclease McrA